MKITFHTCFMAVVLSLCSAWSQAATFHSTQSGDWNDPNTWEEGAIPSTHDDLYIQAGHTVTKTGSAYTHRGNIIIEASAELIANVGNANDGLIFKGDFFHVFGTLSLPYPDKDLSIEGHAIFWGHPTAEIFVSDDWRVSNHAEVIVDGICVRVDDDFHIKGKNATVCGNGGVSIGSSTSNNTFNLQNGASTSQVCLLTAVYRGSGGDCTTLVNQGTGNAAPTATDDTGNTPNDQALSIDVLDSDTPDSDPDGDDLEIVAVGTKRLNNGQTEEGGTVSINNNGTPSDPTDDFIDYMPPLGFEGEDRFTYTITDGNGAYVVAEVSIVVSIPLPVELVHFAGEEKACKINLEWATASEVDSDFFELERSRDGKNFSAIGRREAAGYSKQYKVYEFQDGLPEAENYYRLRQVDWDGSEHFSDIIFVAANCMDRSENIGIVTLFPNPVITNEVQLRFRAQINEEVPLLVADQYGRTLRSEMVNIDAGLNEIRFDLSNYPAGTYWLMLGQRSTRFLKQLD